MPLRTYPHSAVPASAETPRRKGPSLRCNVRVVCSLYGVPSPAEYNRGMKHKGIPFDGIVNLYKPAGITSARALDRVRRITNVRKSGHSGTLDPMACGVLVVCMGKATKLVEQIMDLPKVYAATARLDLVSDTHDADGETKPVEIARPPERDAVASAMASSLGTILQTPPRYSAVKVGGRAAYKLARQGETVRLDAKPVTVYSLEVLRYEWPELDFELSCGRGTYVRSIVRDLGERLEVGGCLTRLERRAVGPFTVEQAVTLDALQASSLGEAAIDIEEARRLLAQPGRSLEPSEDGLS